MSNIPSQYQGNPNIDERHPYHNNGEAVEESTLNEKCAALVDELVEQPFWRTRQSSGEFGSEDARNVGCTLY
jgi:hypothetical protein